MNLLKYNCPANEWNEALPIGNGFTGVMILGELATETLSFNDGTLWSGFPSCYDKEDGAKYIEEVRQLIFDGKNHKADKLAEKHLTGSWSATFLPLGDINLSFENLGTENYERNLDMKKGVHTVKSNGVRAEMFASNPQRICVYRITSKEKFNVKITAQSQLQSKVTVDTGLNLFGNAPDKIIPRGHGEIEPIQYNKHKAMAFALRAEVITDGKTIHNTDDIYVTDANEVTIYFATATGFKAFNEMPETDCDVVLNKAKEHLSKLEKDYEKIKEEHIKDFSELFNRQTLKICKENNLYTDEIIKVARDGGDLDCLSQLMYNFGKYLLISGSRKGGQPLNLQGIWNCYIRPPWSSNYTTNINTQMNYWPASACGLSECIEPLVKMMTESMVTGRNTAEKHFGAKGFCCNHNMDIWRKTSPSMGSAKWFLSPLCGSWLTNELYRHYLNGGLDKYKDEIFSVIKENAIFLMSYLVKHNDKYVICPSTSPENAFRYKFRVSSLDCATAYDMAIVRQSLNYAYECSDDNNFKNEIKEKLDNLYPLQKGKYGIREYYKDYYEYEPGHRHFSPLYAFYPSEEIGYYSDKKKTEWISDLFWRRLNNSHQHVGWSAVWAMCIGARLRDVKAEKKVIRHFITNAIFSNLYCFHEPCYFQIDGNLGFVAGLNELLITEEDGIIELLPAILPEYKNGQMSNIIIKGNHINFEWENGIVKKVESDKPIKIHNKHLSENLKKNENITIVV